MHFGVFKAFAMTCFGSQMNVTSETFGQKHICSTLATPEIPKVSDISGVRSGKICRKQRTQHMETCSFRIHCSFTLYFTRYFFSFVLPEVRDTLLASNRGLSWQQCNLCLSISFNIIKQKYLQFTYFLTFLGCTVSEFLAGNLRPKKSHQI